MTERQAAILVAIIEQYAEVAVPVGSVTLAKLFGVSSATIRSEMARLEELDMIHQPHTSAGRVPTDKGYRFYVNRLLRRNTTRCHASIAVRERLKRACKPMSTELTERFAVPSTVSSS